MAPTLPSSSFSDFSGSSEVSQTEKLPLLADFAMLTLLLRLVVILKNGDGSASLHGFTEGSVGVLQESHVDTELDFTMLNAMGAILGQRNKVVAAKCIKLNSDYFIAMSDPDDAQYAAGQGIAEIRALMSNPSLCQPLGDKLQSLRCLNITQDDGHWGEIQRDPLCRMSAGITNLEQHASTVCAYLKDYRGNPLHRSKYSHKFIKYLLSASWPDIYRRLASWRGLGFIYKLSPSHSKFKLESYRLWKGIRYDTRREKHLVKFILTYPDVIDGLKYAGTSWPKGAPPDWEPPAEDLLHFDALMIAIKGGASQLYTKHTANDFHRLIYASFVTFGRSLRRFGKGISLEKQGKLSLANLGRIFRALQGQAELFFNIVTSSTFRKHIEVLWETDGLGIRDLIPEFSEKESYRMFGKRMSIWDYELITGSTGDVTWEGDSELEFLKAPPEDLTVEAVVEWVKTFLSQFVAKGVLEDQCLSRPGIPIEMSLLAVDPTRYRVPSWDKCKKIITDALSNVVYPLLQADIANVFTCLEDKIKGFQIPCDAEVNKTVDTFKGIIMGRDSVDFALGPHCKAVFGALVKFHPGNELADEDKALSQMCARLNESMVLVAKQCCPVCSELLSTLTEPEQQGAVLVPGCHSTIHSVILPVWLPERIHRVMFLKFQSHLRKELCTLLNLPQTKSARLICRRPMRKTVGFTVGKGKVANDVEIRNIPSRFYLF